jgi:hypothetical protein
MMKSNTGGAGHTLQMVKTRYVYRTSRGTFHGKRPSERHTNIILKLILETKVKVKLSLGLTNQAPCHKDICGSEGTIPLLLTSALDEGERSASCPCKFTHWRNNPQYPVCSRPVGPRADLDVTEKRKISCSYQESSPDTSADKPVA